MGYLKQFVIPFSGLKAGNYTFTFEIDDRFFEHFEYSEVTHGRIHVDVVLERQPRMMVFNFLFAGHIFIPCDRCGDTYSQPLDGEEKLIVKFGPVHEEESEDILVITEDEHELDLSQYIYEYIHLLLPLRKVHGTDEQGNSLCDPDVINRISEKEEPPVDPRWDALRKIKDNIDKQDN
jgi:uncharacterized metal-binding protein YceD (DUF177 family)